MQNNYYQISAEETMSLLKTDKNGLSNKEGKNRILIHGKNILQEGHKIAAWIKFFWQFKNILIILLIASMCISIYLEDYRGATIL